jgi:lipoprotein-anchoring transpeptidase ErfK/SrfK
MDNQDNKDVVDNDDQSIERFDKKVDDAAMLGFAALTANRRKAHYAGQKHHRSVSTADKLGILAVAKVEVSSTNDSKIESAVTPEQNEGLVVDTSVPTSEASDETLSSREESLLVHDNNESESPSTDLEEKRVLDEFVTHNDKNNVKHRWLTRKIFAIPVVSIVILSSLLVSAFYYFTNHALPNTFVAGEDVSFQSKKKIEARINGKINDFNITIVSRDTVLTPTLQDLGVNIDATKTLLDFSKSQGGFGEMLKPWKKRSSNYSTSYDVAKSQAYFETIRQNVDQESLDAVIQIDKGTVTIIPEVISKVSGLPDADKKLQDSLQTLSPLALTLEVYEDQPDVTAKDLEASKAQIEQIIATPVALIINGKKILPSKEQISSWITLSKKDGTSLPLIVLDNVRVTSYVESAIKPYIEPPRARVVVKNEDGTERELSPGADGIDVTDKVSVVQSIIDSVSKAKAITKEVPVSYAARPTVVAGDYEKWLEADLTTKRLYAYEHGNLVNTFLVTAGAPETPTVVGQFAIRTKVRSQTMRGLNTDGTRYNVPNVEWVSYFYQDYAIHGNYWRADSVFGNQNTSHGCVSLKNSGAEWVYNWAPIGTPVITHY